MPLGGTARFKVEVAGGTVPDADITWTIKEGAGRVAFAGGSTGPEVAVTATSTGAFRLEVDIKGLVITPPHVRPYFTGTVYPAVNVPVTVWVVKDEYGDPIRPLTTIPGLLADANKILWQRGLTLVQSGPCHLLNNTNWLNHVNVLAETNAVIDAMMDSTNSMGNAVELYFVRTLDGKATAGVRRPKGIAIASGVGSWAIAHEVLHDCGLEDIYIADDQGNPLLEPVAEQSIPADWGGGYYNPWVLQHGLIKRLVMRSRFDLEEDAGVDLPSGDVRGWHHGPGGGGTPTVLGPAKVGQSSIIRTPGSH